jgi:hypothetical protein
MGSLLKSLGQQLTKKLVSRQGMETGSRDSEVTPYTLSDITKPIGDTVKPIIKKSLKPVTDVTNAFWGGLNPSQQSAARTVLYGGGAAAGVGATLGLLSMVNRKHRRELLDESVARASLEYPVVDTSVKSGGFFDRAFASSRGAAENVVGGISNVGNFALDVAGPTGEAIRNEGRRALDLPGTIAGNHAKNWYSVPWAIPALAGALGLGSIGAYKGVRGLVASHDKAKLERRKQKAKQKFMDALIAEQQSKLGSVLDEYLDTVVEVSTIKEASALETYLSLLGLAGLGGGIYGFSRSYGPSKRKSNREALEQVRNLQRAKYEFETPEIIPDYQVPQLKKKEEPTLNKEASIKGAVDFAKGAWGLGKFLAGGAKAGVVGGVKGLGSAYKAHPFIGSAIAAEGLGAGVQSLAPGSKNPNDYMNDAGFWATYVRPSQQLSRFLGMKANPTTDKSGRNYYGRWARYSADPNRTSELTFKGPISGIRWDQDRWLPDFSKANTHIFDGGWDFWDKNNSDDTSYLANNTVIPNSTTIPTQQRTYTALPSARAGMRFG